MATVSVRQTLQVMTPGQGHHDGSRQHSLLLSRMLSSAGHRVDLCTPGVYTDVWCKGGTKMHSELSAAELRRGVGALLAGDACTLCCVHRRRRS